MTINKNWEPTYSEQTVLPLLHKVFKGRWYVVAKRIDNYEIRTYSLDRIVEFSILEKHTTNTEDLSGYFQHSFGIYDSNTLTAARAYLEVFIRSRSFR